MRKRGRKGNGSVRKKERNKKKGRSDKSGKRLE